MVKRLSAALERELGALAGVIDSSLMYCRAQTKQAKLRPDEILVSGGGSMLPGLPEALARRMRMRVNRLEPFRKISLGALPPEDVAELSAQAPRYAAAVGLAASRLEPGAVRFSLVPESVKARRRFLEGGIYMWYAAALILIIAGILTWVPWRNSRIVAAEKDKREDLQQSAEKASQEFDQTYYLAMQRRDEVEALEERVYSGRDIVRVLSHLKKHTWGPNGRFRDIIVLEASNTPPSRVVDVTEEERKQSFQKARRVYIRGVVTVPASPTAKADATVRARQLIGEYAKELEKPDPDNDIIKTAERPVTESDAQMVDSGHARLDFVIKLILQPTKGRPGEAAGSAPRAGSQP
jgi:cell division ATPase FtsA